MGARSGVVGIVIAALAAASPALAQRVRGTLTDSSTHEPIPGAVVSIADSAGRFLARGVAGADGHFDVPRLPGSRQVHVIRIGYRPIDATVGAEDEPLALQMRAIASQLATVTTSGRRVCPGESARSDALQLWEQVRAGFFASIVARQARPPTLRLRFFRLERDPVLRRIEDDTVWVKDVVGDESFVAARTATAFASDGYMRERPGGEREFYAPDEAVLLDPAFAASHCLRVTAADASHPNQVGIAFDPVEAERDSLVDVRGVVWLDQANLNLRTLDFVYTNLEKVKDGSGGSITFELTPNGVPMIVRWTIHTPIIATENQLSASGVRRSLLPRPVRTAFRVLGYQETGGDVRRVTWSDGPAWKPHTVAITGLVVDLHGRVVPGATVWLSGVPDTVVTDSTGLFRFPRPVISGLYFLMAADSVLASVGFNQTVPRSIVVTDDRSPTRDIDLDVLKMFPRADALRAACPSGKYVPGQGVAIVKVVDTTAVAVAGARVDVETIQNVIVGDTIAKPVRRSGETGRDGRFMVCGAALDQPMRFRASVGDGRGEAGIATWTNDVVVLTVVLRRGAP
jgi:hypothetical protein